MRGTPESMTVLRPRNARGAMKLYAATPGALPIAGGTDVMVAWNLGALDGRAVLDLSAIDAWRAIEASRTKVRIGALATHAAIRDHRAVRRLFPLLSESAATVGGVQIQNRGTLGGNLANASPAADTFPALSVYEAVVVVSSTAGSRRCAIDDLFAGPKRTHLGPGELIEAVEITVPGRPPDRQLFRKVGTRAAQAISKVVMAGVLWLAPDGRVEGLRVAVGSVAPTVKRLRAAERAVTDLLLTDAVVEQAIACVSDDISPIDDLRSTREYRLLVAQRLLGDFLRGKQRRVGP
jgi:CO/xanthine dehydrogenase FAD-binding subunit